MFSSVQRKCISDTGAGTLETLLVLLYVVISLGAGYVTRKRLDA
jgi:hypothetical protein